MDRAPYLASYRHYLEATGLFKYVEQLFLPAHINEEYIKIVYFMIGMPEHENRVDVIIEDFIKKPEIELKLYIGGEGCVYHHVRNMTGLRLPIDIKPMIDELVEETKSRIQQKKRNNQINRVLDE